MAVRKKEVVETDKSVKTKGGSVRRFYGWQLLKLPRYRNRIAQLVIEKDSLYSYEEADKAISNFKKKKG